MNDQLRPPSAEIVQVAKDWLEKSYQHAMICPRGQHKSAKCICVIPGEHSLALAIDVLVQRAVAERTEECAKIFDAKARESDDEAVEYENRPHPARSSARQCRERADRFREHAAEIRSLRPASEGKES